MSESTRPYQLLSCTIGLCPRCLRRLDAKIVEHGGRVYLQRCCPEHGFRQDILEESAAYYRARLEYDRPSTASSVQTQINEGCPHDCGLCPSHEQHTCIGLLEITQRCDLKCPACYAHGSEPDVTLEQAGRMMDFFLESEQGKAEVLQVSGGEPSQHAAVLDILRLAKTKGFRFVMLNTNGLRIAEDENFVRELATLLPAFEVYLQFDGLTASSSTALRERDLVERKLAAVARLSEAGVPVTLVATVQRRVNEHEVGDLVRFGLQQDAVRGVNFQPVAFFRGGQDEAALSRVTLTEILRLIEEQTDGLVTRTEFVPLPCDVDRVALTYLYRDGDTFVPITRKVDLRPLARELPNTFAFDAETMLAAACGGACECMTKVLSDLRPMIPPDFTRRNANSKVAHWGRDVFRISVSSFVDPYNFDLRSMQKECVHVITRDLRRIPFSSYNMLHRELR